MNLPEAVRRMFDAAKTGPQPFSRLAEKAAILYDEAVPFSEDDVVRAVVQEGEGGAVRLAVGQQLARWDAEADASWAQPTPRNSAERRQAIYELMGLSPATREVLDDKVPFFDIQRPTIVTAANWTPWYVGDRRTARTFYWDALEAQLRNHLGWAENSIISLDEATTAVVERLWDPTATARYQSKGLVVGYVQSGKTANITGVLAKAADAGYRLIIVLAGTLNLLREQTQRRIDRELVGAELLDDEYLDDSDWPNFLRHGRRPSELGAFDWVRLTSRKSDYRQLKGGAIEAMRFSKTRPELPFNHPDNLHRSAVRLLVVKKNADVLKRLAKDLARVNPGGELEEVPALIIDDESDQASVNTVRPLLADEDDESRRTERTRINHAIVGLLKELKRAQYVGYTATPFANVFVDPTDEADLFPRDFIISLPRPFGYLGASDFHDLYGPPPGFAKNEFLSNERAFVRRLEEDADDELLDAIDSFVLSGAIKLYRQSSDPGLKFQHHTMMIHTSPKVADHAKHLKLARELLERSGYRMGTATGRLQELYETDFAPVAATRAAGMPMPQTFDELEPHLGEMLSRLYYGGDPVLLVNSTSDATQLAFDSEPVWKIIVGGAKLSRGFTVEGLTITYFRRRSKMADTLMQMGRWCGYRKGYDDLIRLFIGGEDDGAYAAFEAVCRDEDAFRTQLARYATPSDGSPPITPLQVPPLVLSHAQWVKPTAKNKMFNARITFRNFGDLWSEHRRVVQSDEGRRHNEHLVREFLLEFGLTKHECAIERRSLTLFGAVVPSVPVRELLASYRWADNGPDLQRELEFLDGEVGDPGIDSWQVLLPQLQNPGTTWKVGDKKLSVHFRSYWNDEPPLVNAYVGSDERAVAEAITGRRPRSGRGIDELVAPRRGVLMVYPITHEKNPGADWVPTMGISLLFPRNHLTRQIGFAVQRPGEPNAPIVDVRR